MYIRQIWATYFAFSCDGNNIPYSSEREWYYTFRAILDETEFNWILVNSGEFNWEIGDNSIEFDGLFLSSLNSIELSPISQLNSHEFTKIQLNSVSSRMALRLSVSWWCLCANCWTIRPYPLMISVRTMGQVPPNYLSSKWSGNTTKGFYLRRKRKKVLMAMGRW